MVKTYELEAFDIVEGDLIALEVANRIETFSQHWHNIYRNVSYRHGREFSFKIHLLDYTKEVSVNDSV